MTPPSMCALLLLFSGLSQAVRRGVGFSLSRTHAEASVAYENGDSWDIAKVSGSRMYRCTMDSADVRDDIEVIPAELPGPMGPEFTCGNPLFELFHTPQVPMGLQYIYDELLPLWLGGHERDAATQAFTGMLRTLKTATESALNTEIEAAYIATPYPIGDRIHSRMRAAASAVGLKVQDKSLSAAEAIGYTIGRNCSSRYNELGVMEDQSESVLILDHSEAELTATLSEMDCVSFDIRRIMASVDFGARELDDPEGWLLRLERSSQSEAEKQQKRQDRHEMLVDALRRLITLPSEGSASQNTSIDRLMVVGESSSDMRLKNSLQDVFGDRLEVLLGSPTEDFTGSCAPAYTVAQHVAKRCLDDTTFASGI